MKETTAHPVKSLSDPIETLVVKQAITEVLHRYCYAVDRIDADLGAQIWHPDGMAYYDGIFEGTGQDFMQWVLETHRGVDATSHQLTNVLIDVDGERAGSESYVTACIRSGGTDIVARGRYQDSWSRRSGEWRIDERRYCHDIAQTLPVNDRQS